MASLLQAFPDEFVAHVEQRGCPLPRTIELPKLVDLAEGVAVDAAPGAQAAGLDVLLDAHRRDRRCLRLHVRHVLRCARKAKVKVVLDVRQRRGVRGAEYSSANAVRLQAALADAGIEYRHLRELAPTTAMREVQYRDEAKEGVRKRSRIPARAWSRVSTRSRSSIVFDLDVVIDALPEDRRCHTALRRARPRGVPSVARRRSPYEAARGRGRAPPPRRSLRCRFATGRSDSWTR